MMYIYIYIYICVCVCVYISLLYTFCRSRNTSDIVCRIPHALTSSPLITRCFRFDYWLSSGSHAVFICLSIICSRWTKRSEICMHNKRSVARNTALVVQRRGLITQARATPKGNGQIIIVLFICIISILMRENLPSSGSKRRFSTIIEYYTHIKYYTRRLH